MSITIPHPPRDLDVALRPFDDPWSLDAAARQLLRRHLDGAQRHWLPRLRRLVEPPAPGDGFPAFLLATAPFEPLRAAIGAAEHSADLDTGTADELQHFVDAYRGYLDAGATGPVTATAAGPGR